MKTYSNMQVIEESKTSLKSLKRSFVLCRFEKAVKYSTSLVRSMEKFATVIKRLLNS